MSLQLLVVSVAAGFLLGVVSGLVPGIHVNTFSFILLSLLPLFESWGVSGIYVVFVIVGNYITHTFLDIIPSVFLGAPDADTALAVLPGHRMLLDGEGVLAVRLSALGSACAVVTSLVLALPVGVFFWFFYQEFQSRVVWILLAFVLVLILTEKGERVEGEGSLVPLKYKFWALVVFLLSGLLGVIAFRVAPDISPLFQFLGVEGAVFMPLLTGLFGAPPLILSLFSGGGVLPQQSDGVLDFRGLRLFGGVLAGSISGAFVAWLPGVSSGVATVLARIFIRTGEKEFLVALSSANTANAIYTLVAFFVIGLPRSGAVVAVKEIIGSLDLGLLILLLALVSGVSFVAYFTTVFLGKKIVVFLDSLDYRLLCKAVLVFLFSLVFVFTGLLGLMIFMVALVIGLLPPLLGVRRVHAMGVIIMPVMLFWLL